jgi:adenosylhomocysteine nucleosidase
LASGDAKVTGVVAALRAEARCAAVAVDHSGSASGAATLRVRHSGIGVARATRAAQQLLRAGADALLCFGIGGALDVQLRSGDIVLASEIVCDASLELEGATRLPTTIAWRRQLEQSLARVGRVRVGPVLTCRELVCNAEDKRARFAESGALVVDMESAAVAAVARARGVPFMTVRVVADTAMEELPPALQYALAPSVTARAQGVFSLLSMPRNWPALARLASSYRAAQAVLSGCARAGIACEAVSPVVATA